MSPEKRNAPEAAARRFLARDVWTIVDTAGARIQQRAARLGVPLEDVPGILEGLETAAGAAVGPRPETRPAPRA